jgi:AbrB family looped-hinge helix DNA binding protein
MKVAIDSAGRLVIPKTIRDAARIGPGTEVDVALVGEFIEVRPVSTNVRLRREGRLLVATPGPGTGTLSAAAVPRKARRSRER